MPPSLFAAQYCCDRKSRPAYAQSFALWQQGTIELTCHDHSIIACSRHVYVWCYSSHTSRSWWITQSTQHHRRGCNNIPSFLQQPHRSHVLCVKAELGTTFISWSQHHFVDVCVSHSVTHKHELWIWFTLSYAMMKALLRLAAVRDTKEAGELRGDTVHFIVSSSALVLMTQNGNIYRPLTQTATCLLRRYSSKHIAENS